MKNKKTKSSKLSRSQLNYLLATVGGIFKIQKDESGKLNVYVPDFVGLMEKNKNHWIDELRKKIKEK